MVAVECSKWVAFLSGTAFAHNTRSMARPPDTIGTVNALIGMWTSWSSVPGPTRLAAALLLVLSLVAPVGAQPQGREFYASPTGLATSSGTIDQPLDLTKALSSSSPLRPGDTLWLRGGRYVGNFTSVLTGTPTAPIIVRQFRGERATLDANTPNRALPGLAVLGADTWYWGFEVTDSNPARINAGGFNNPTLRATSIDVYAARTRFINLVVHDGAQGMGFWSNAIDAEIYGSVIYNVGVEAPDRGHGHSVYVQNQSGWKRLVDNIMFNGFSFGIHAYTEGGRIDNIHMEGNTLFGHGLLSARSGAKANILMGGGDIADFPRVLSNYSYYPSLDGRGLDLSYGNGCQGPDVRGNYSVAAQPVVVSACTNVTMTGNTLYGNTGSQASQFPNNVFHATRPTGVRTFVRPNAYEAGRANITIFNWDLLPVVAVDVSMAGLAVGDVFEVRDAQNYFGAPVATGVFTGASVSIPMTGLVAAPPVGSVPLVLPHTAPQFGAFVLMRTQSAPAPVGPTIATIQAATSPAGGGGVVTITGSGFGTSAAVSFGGVAATQVAVAGSTSLTAVVPAHPPGVVDVVLTTNGHIVTGAAAFQYVAAPPLLLPAVVNGQAVSLAWQAGAHTPSLGYLLLGGATPGGTEYGAYPMGMATSTGAVVGDGRYYVRIVATTPWGLVASNEIVVTVGASDPPGTPTLDAATVTGAVVRMSWTTPSGSPSHYTVLARYAPSGPVIAALPVVGSPLSVTAPPGTYFVTVVAHRALGISAESNQITVVVP